VQKLASIIPLGKDDIYLRVPPFLFLLKKQQKIDQSKKGKRKKSPGRVIERRDWNYLSDNLPLNRCSSMCVCSRSKASKCAGT
jgi:hypothetical protein